MLKRIFPLFTILILVVFIFVPPLSVSAGGVSGTSDDVRYAALTFDSIEYDCVFEYPSTCTWPFPFNSCVQGYGKFSFGSPDFPDYISGYSSVTDDPYFPVIVGAMTLPSLSPSAKNLATVSFTGGQQIFQCGRVRDYTISFSPSDLVISKVALSGCYNIVDFAGSVNDKYVVNHLYFDLDVNDENGKLYIGRSLTDYFAEASEDSFIFLEYIRLDIEFYRISASSSRFEFDIPTDGSIVPNMHADLHNWLNQFDTSVNISYSNPAYFSVSSWINEALGGFLEFEIAPGFSINGIFTIVLVVGVLLWFIRLIS